MNISSLQPYRPYGYTVQAPKFGCPACVAAATTVVTGVAGLSNATLNKGNAAVATGVSTALGGLTGSFLYGISALGWFAAPVAVLGGAVTSALTAWSILNTQDHKTNR